MASPRSQRSARATPPSGGRAPTGSRRCAPLLKGVWRHALRRDCVELQSGPGSGYVPPCSVVPADLDQCLRRPAALLPPGRPTRGGCGRRQGRPLPGSRCRDDRQERDALHLQQVGQHRRGPGGAVGLHRPVVDGPVDLRRDRVGERLRIACVRVGHPPPGARLACRCGSCNCCCSKWRSSGTSRSGVRGQVGVEVSLEGGGWRSTVWNRSVGVARGSSGSLASGVTAPDADASSTGAVSSLVDTTGTPVILPGPTRWRLRWLRSGLVVRCRCT